jgi:hypothetical protein
MHVDDDADASQHHRSERELELLRGLPSPTESPESARHLRQAVDEEVLRMSRYYPV